MFSALYNGVTAVAGAAQQATGALDDRSSKYAAWILENVFRGDKNAIVGCEIEVTPRADGFGVFGTKPFVTKCKSMNYEAGYITLQGGDYPDAEEIWCQRVCKVNGVSIPQLFA